MKKRLWIVFVVLFLALILNTVNVSSEGCYSQCEFFGDEGTCISQWSNFVCAWDDYFQCHSQLPSGANGCGNLGQQGCEANSEYGCIWNPNVFAVCGNGVVDAGEECDAGANNGMCPSTCSGCRINNCANTCGNGILEWTEECDAGANNGMCPNSCGSSCTTNQCASDSCVGPLTENYYFKQSFTYADENELNLLKTPAAVSITKNTPPTPNILYLLDPETVQDGVSPKMYSFYPNGGTGFSGLTSSNFGAPVATALASLSTYYDTLFIADMATSPTKKNIYSLNINTQVITPLFGGRGTGNGLFAGTVAGIAVDSSNNIYVSDTWNHRIQKFSSNGNYLTQWGTLGTGNGQFNATGGVAVDSSGNVYVVDQINKRIQKFSSTGTYITKWSVPYYPYGIAIGPSDTVFVSEFGYYDTGLPRVYKYSSTGVYITAFGADLSSNETYIWTPWGETYLPNNRFIDTRGVTVDTDGDVYVADYGGARVQKWGQIPASCCGNTFVEGTETCDDGNSNNGDGCSNTCQATCGNGIVDIGEQCDGSNLNGQTCGTLGYTAGNLACNAPATPAQCSFNINNCSNVVVPVSNPCKINNAYISTSANCANGGADCTSGNTIYPTIQYNGSCSAGTYIYFNASSADGLCKIQSSGGQMIGLYNSTLKYAMANIPGPSTSNWFNYAIPSIPAACLNKQITKFSAVVLNGSPGVGTNISNYYNASTNFRLNPYCGNSVVEGSEECDVGIRNGVVGSGCSNLCVRNNCSITAVTVNTLTCVGLNCSQGDKLNATMTFYGPDCTLGNFAQIDFFTANRDCIVQANGLNISGINSFVSVNPVVVDTNSGSITGNVINPPSVNNNFNTNYTYIFPDIPNTCAGKILKNISAQLYTGNVSVSGAKARTPGFNGVNNNQIRLDQCPQFGALSWYSVYGSTPVYNVINSNSCNRYTCNTLVANPAIEYNQTTSDIGNELTADAVGGPADTGDTEPGFTLPMKYGIKLFNGATYIKHECGIEDNVCPDHFSNPVGSCGAALGICARNGITDQDCQVQIPMKCGNTTITNSTCPLGCQVSTCAVPTPTPYNRCAINGTQVLNACLYANEAGTPTPGANETCWSNGGNKTNKNGNQITCIGQVGATITNVWCPKSYSYSTTFNRCVPPDTAICNFDCPYAVTIANRDVSSFFPIWSPNWSAFIVNYINDTDCWANRTGGRGGRLSHYCGVLSDFPQNIYDFMDINAVYTTVPSNPNNGELNTD